MGKATILLLPTNFYVCSVFMRLCMCLYVRAYMCVYVCSRAAFTFHNLGS